MADAVRVAVRVRPFNSREKDRKAKCIISMNGPTTLIRNPETDETKDFAFDFSYWSHDGSMTDPATGQAIPDGPTSNYASQRKVYDDIGEDILKNAFEGYNCSLFAYGQTGAGKSYSMVGYGVDKGIVPIICDEMFKKTESDTNENVEYKIVVSMLEIYNEAVRDLLNPKANPPGGLQVRSRPGVGVYVDGLTPFAVANYAEIDAAMEAGTKNRTVASTAMNNTSSRAHTVFTIQFQSLTKDPEHPTAPPAEMKSRINLVDLAGSERADSTGATGDRLKEGCAINQSLSALGNVISALADKAGGKKKNVFIPYRNSVLTRLLQDALGGNSKTIMIAALSPADINYEETLSTLRYADRAKKIKNAVKKNENPTDAIIKELKAENDRLKALLEGKGITADKPAAAGGDDSAAAKQLEEMKKKYEEEMKRNAALIEQQKAGWDEMRKQTTTIMEDQNIQAAGAAAAIKMPYIVNLHEDPMLSEVVTYPFKEGETKIGRKDAEEKQDIVLGGLNVKQEHAKVEYKKEEDTITLTPLNKSKTFVNGELILEPTKLSHGDRLLIGNNFMFRFHKPKKEDDAKKETEKEPETKVKLMDYSEAMDEVNQKGQARLQEALAKSNQEVDQFEQKKRDELEAKLKAMEAQVEKAKAEAEAKLKQQEEEFMKKMAGQMSEEERAKWLEDQKGKTDSELQKKMAELEKQQALNQQIMQDQMKRKRTTKKVEADLARLMPMIKEANDIGAELGKPVRFEPRMVVKSSRKVPGVTQEEEIKDTKMIEVSVRCSNADGSYSNWDFAKFEQRIYLMRDYYARHQQGLVSLDNVSEDPYWDPPDPVLIGSVFVHLKALSQLVEVDLSFDVVDYKGSSEGKLTVKIMPEEADGEQCDYLEECKELIGKTTTFNVQIPEAKGLTEKYSNDIFCKYEFNGAQYQTPVCEGKTRDPKFNYSQKIAVKSDQAFLDYLLGNTMVFELYGFTDLQKKTLQETAGASELNPYSGTSRCDQCEERDTEWDCPECGTSLCTTCWDVLHKSKKKKEHERIPHVVQGDDYQIQVPDGAVACDQCEEQVATVKCEDCALHYCDACNAVKHKSKKKQSHNRVPLDSSTSTAPEETKVADEKTEKEEEPKKEPAAEAKSDAKEESEDKKEDKKDDKKAGSAVTCGQCEEKAATVKCVDCDQVFCDDDFALLHKSARKKEHTKVAL